MFVQGASERLFVEDTTDPVQDCTGRVFYDVRSNKVSRCAMMSWEVHCRNEREHRSGGNELLIAEENARIDLLDGGQVVSILAHLPVPALLCFGMTCKRYRVLADTDALWALICKREWGARAVEAWPAAGRHKLGWKRLYRQMLMLTAASWHRVQQGDVTPSPRASHSLNFLDGSVQLFGGGCDGGRHLDDTWFAQMPNYPVESTVWKRLQGEGPPGRFGQSCCVVGKLLVLYGGINDKGHRLGDTWVCGPTVSTSGDEQSLKWQLLDVSAAPPFRGAHGGSYAGDMQLVIFGGIASDQTRLGDTWLLDLSETPPCWKEIVTPFSPRPRSGHSLTWIGGKRIILFGGRGIDFEVMNDVWLLDLESEFPVWVELQPLTGSNPGYECPAPRAGHTATLIFGGRIVIFGGEDSRRARKGDVWVLDPSAGFQVTHNSPIVETFGRHRSCGNPSNSKGSRRFWKKLKQCGRRPGKRSFHAACAVDTGHMILVLGGMEDGEVIPPVASGLGFDSELHILQLIP